MDLRPNLRERTPRTLHYHYYHIYNLRLRSTLPLPELLPAEGEAWDVTVEEGAVSLPAEPGESYFGGTMTCHYNLVDPSILLILKDAGVYEVRKNHIRILREPGVTDAMLKVYLLGIGMAALLQVRGFFPLHGSGVSDGEKAFMFVGHSGAGKSTTAQSLRASGYSLLSDDLCLVTLDKNGQAWLHPAYPLAKLWPDSAQALQMESDSLGWVLEDYQKYWLPFGDRFVKKAQPLEAIFLLEAASELNCADPLQITGGEKLNVLLNNLYRGFMSEQLGKILEVFQFCGELASRIDVFSVLRPRAKGKAVQKEDIDTFRETIIKTIG